MAGKVNVVGVTPHGAILSFPITAEKPGKDTVGPFFILALGKPILFPEIGSSLAAGTPSLSVPILGKSFSEFGISQITPMVCCR
jgi:hypothetical protein